MKMPPLPITRTARSVASASELAEAALDLRQRIRTRLDAMHSGMATAGHEDTVILTPEPPGAEEVTVKEWVGHVRTQDASGSDKP
jgi:hypothetical protein